MRRRLKQELANRLDGGFTVLATDLYSLQGDERDVALDAVVSGAPSPFVLVHGELACTGAVELAAVLDAIASSRLRDRV